MKLTVFGATGRIGGEVVRQALAEGHTVTAVVRDAARFAQPDHPLLHVATVPDLTDAPLMHTTVQGADAALSGVGPRRRGDAMVASATTRGILEALAAAGVPRFVAVSAMPVGAIPDGEGWLGRLVLYPVARRLLAPVYADLARMEDDIRASGTKWTVVRPPRLTSKPLGEYRTAIGGNVPGGHVVSRADVAHAMLAALGDRATFGQALGVAR